MRKVKLIMILVVFFLVFCMEGVFAQREEIEERELVVPPDDIIMLIRENIPQPPGSSIHLIPGLNKLVIRNTPSNILKTEEFLRYWLTPPQIAIEAKFVTVGEDTFRDLGLEWVGIRGAIRGCPMELDILPGIMPPETDLDIPLIMPGLTLAVLDNLGFRAVLRLLAAREDTNFLSAPRVTTMNAQPASIEFLTTVPYIEDIEIHREVIEGVVYIRYEYHIAEVDVGIFLNVTPRVIEAIQSVELFLQPIVSDVVDWKVLGIAPGLTVERPILESKDLATNVTVADGSTLVLGGLMREETRKVVSKIPLLGDIPIIGRAFFQRDAIAKDRSHLLIFVTVNVLDPLGAPFFATE